MDRQVLVESLRLWLKLDNWSQIVTASVGPGGLDTTDAATPSPADAERLRAMKAIAGAAWKVKPMAAMLDDPLPLGVIAQIIRPADATSAPTVVMSRLSARIRVFNDARSALVLDILRQPQLDGERTFDLYEDGRMVVSDGTVRSISLHERQPGNVAGRAVQQWQLARVLAKFNAAPRATISGRSAHVLRWPV
jgi:hypothetical protein